MAYELRVVTGVTQFDAVDADCIAVGRVACMTPTAERHLVTILVTHVHTCTVI